MSRLEKLTGPVDTGLFVMLLGYVAGYWAAKLLTERVLVNQVIAEAEWIRVSSAARGGFDDLF